MTSAPSPDLRAARRAARHLGLLTRSAAHQCGLSDKQIAQRLATGRWEKVHRGVYHISGAPPTPEQVAYAAVLAACPEARVAGLSSLALVGVGSFPATPWIAVPSSASGRHESALVRRSPVPAPDRAAVGPIPATTPARAALESAPHISDDLLVGLVDEVITRGLTTPSTVLGAIRRAQLGPGRAGSVRLREALRPWIEGIVPGSAAEVRLIRRFEDWGLPPPVRQYKLVGPAGQVAFLDWRGLRASSASSTTVRPSTRPAASTLTSSARSGSARWDGGSDGPTATTCGRPARGCARSSRSGWVLSLRDRHAPPGVSCRNAPGRAGRARDARGATGPARRAVCVVQECALRGWSCTRGGSCTTSLW